MESEIEKHLATRCESSSPKLVDSNDILFAMDWIMKYPSGTLKFGRADYDPNDLRTVVEYIDGVGFMKSVVTFFEQRHILNYRGPHLGIATVQHRMERECT